MKDLQFYLERGHVLIADGAIGTMLQTMGLPVGTAPDLWNVERPDAIRALHRAYLDAGSQVILTNTFGGNRIKLERAGLGARIEEVNRAAVTLAREEAAGEAFVAGDVGPTGELLAPYGTLAYEEAVDVYAQQASILAESKVDLLWIETMIDLNETRAAVEGIQQATRLPIFCSLSFGRSGRTMMGATPAQVAETLWPLGLAAIGGNCGEGVDVMTLVLTEMRTALQKLGVDRYTLIAKPNAGLPRLENGQTVFDLGPEALAAYVPQFLELGARIVGGCCGSTPEHIAAMAQRYRVPL